MKFHLPIRVRLTLWYITLLAVTFTAFGIYVLLRFQNSLRVAVDHSLAITVSKTIASLDEEDFHETGKLTFDIVSKSQIQTAGFAMRIIDVDGVVWDTYGETGLISDWGTPPAGYSTTPGYSKWRVLTQPVLDSNQQIIAWVQAAQSIAAIDETVRDLRDQVGLAVPLILVLAGLGGYFLSDRALSPIQQITNTAREITAQDLSRRLSHQGAKDEVGGLARTFDEMLARLQESFERERRFTSDAAHELRTPLTVLKGQIEVALDRPRERSEYEDKLRALLEQVERLIRLSNALLFLSQSDKDQLPFNETEVDLTDLLGILIEQFKPLADNKDLRLSTLVARELSTRGDQDQLVRLFMNLLDNALKYTPAHGEVTVSAAKEAGGIRVKIINSGAGIGEEHIPHLFERFYRVGTDRSSQTGGLGLGLAIAREIARKHGGSIEIDSHPGDGVSVTVTFPLAK